MRVYVIASLISVVAGAALAEPINYKAAKGMMFKSKGAVVTLIPHPSVSEKDAKVLKQVGETQAYYGAIAMSPSEGLASPALVAATNHHSVESASAQAIEFCNDKRESGSKKCVVVAQIFPKKWKAKPVQFSAGATEAFGKEYRRIRGDKAFATAASTGDFGIGKGETAAAQAVENCAAKNGATDCEVTIAD